MVINWIPPMAILIMSRAITEIAKMAMSAIMATIVMVNGNFSMATRGMQHKKAQ